MRLESIGYVLVSAIALLVLAFFVVLWPLMFKAAAAYAPWLEPLQPHLNFARFGIGGMVLAVALFILHMWLPAGRRSLGRVWPGIAATLVLWLACGFTFGHYLADFAYTYVTYYAGLASAMIALVFLYYSAWIFVYGGELNAENRPRCAEHSYGQLTPSNTRALFDCRVSSGSEAASSDVLEIAQAGRVALTSTAMLPGLWRLVRINSCA